MAAHSSSAYRISVRPAPHDRSRYLWTINGTQSMFSEESSTAYSSVEDALAEANARLAQICR